MRSKPVRPGPAARFSAILLAGLALAGCAGTTPDPDYMIVGYAFQRVTDIEELDLTKVTHLNYAFGLIYNEEYLELDPGTDERRGTPVNTDVQTPEPVPEGRLHTIYLPPRVRSDLTRLRELRGQNPELKVLLSVGGWGARGFSDMAMTRETRAVFVESAIEVIDEFELDGIDLDWEFPVSGGWGEIRSRPEDRENFTLLLSELRSALGPEILLTIAGSPNLDFATTWTEFKEIVELVDFINVMTYDFQYDSYFGSALYASKRWSAPADIDYHTDMAIRNYIDHGAPPEKLNLGLAFAAPIPAVVRSSPVFPEIREKLESAGYFDAELPLLERVGQLLAGDHGFTAKWDDDARNMYITTTLGDGEEYFVLSYIEPRSISAKLDYIRERQLGGVFFWEFGADHDNSIVRQLHRELRE